MITIIQKLRPVKLVIESMEKFSGEKTRIQFTVTFQMALELEILSRTMVVGRRLYFTSNGLLDSEKAFDNQSLMNLLETTDYDRYLKANMKHRENGSFYYQYMYNEDSLAINFTTF